MTPLSGVLEYVIRVSCSQDVLAHPSIHNDAHTRWAGSCYLRDKTLDLQPSESVVAAEATL